MSIRSSCGAALLAAIWLAGGAPLAAQPSPAPVEKPIVIGTSVALPSAVMGKVRTLNIWLPPGYADSKQSYPVLYLLDGGIDQDFHHISGLAQLGTIVGTTRDMIVVGIETVDRRNELAFPPLTDARLRADYPTAGQSDRFRRFIAQDVKPWVKAHYRTSGGGAVMGESLAGLFVVETLLRQPGLFDDYIAISPSLWWDNEALNKAAPALLSGTAGHRLWLSVANEEGMGVAPLAALLKRQAPAGLHWTYAPRPDETHATIYHGAALAAIRALFAVPPEKASG